MPIFRRALPEEIHEAHVVTRDDVPGRETGTTNHGGSCALRGLSILGGRSPTCGPSCEGPYLPFYVAVTHQGLVLEVGHRTATTWDSWRRRPVEVPLDDDPVFPAYAEVDAAPKLWKTYESWLSWRDIEADLRATKAKERAKAAKLAEEEKKNQAWAAFVKEARRRAEEEQLRIRKGLSVIKRGSPVMVVLDPPGFVERNRRLKPRNRAPSLVGTRGVVAHEGSYLEPYVFVRKEDGTTIRLRRDVVRVILHDGSVGEPDLL